MAVLTSNCRFNNSSNNMQNVAALEPTSVFPAECLQFTKPGGLRLEKVKWDEFLVPVINVADTMIHSITFPLHLPAFTINYRPGRKSRRCGAY